MWRELWGCVEVLGEVWKRELGCGGGKGRCGEKCREMYRGVGEVMGDVRGEGLGMWESVAGGVGKCVGVQGR